MSSSTQKTKNEFDSSCPFEWTAFLDGARVNNCIYANVEAGVVIVEDYTNQEVFEADEDEEDDLVFTPHIEGSVKVLIGESKL